MNNSLEQDKLPICPPPLSLEWTEEGLSLKGMGMSMTGDFTSMLPRLSKGRLMGEMLVKAAKLKGFERMPLVVDATAGMGEDSMLLAAAGYRVILYEANPIIAALLEDSLQRARNHPILSEYANRMKVVEGDSVEGLLTIDEKPDVVYLDPMFPARQKSGLIKKKFQLLQKLEMPCQNEEDLFNAAMKAGPKKIVIKRPLKGPYLAGHKPSYSLTGKAIRYDCVVL